MPERRLIPISATPATTSPVGASVQELCEGAEPLGPDDPSSIGPYLLTAKLPPGGWAAGVYIGTPFEPIGGVGLVLIKVYIKGEVRLRSGITRDIEQLHRVASPHVARVFGVIEAETAFAVIREFIPGRSLQQVIDDHPEGLEWPPLFAFADGALEGLVTLHSKGVVHGSVKPSNVIVGDRPVLVDINLVEPAPQSRGLRDDPVAQSYESPEQRRSRLHSAPADVYAWAVVALAASDGIQFHVDSGPFFVKPDTSGVHRRLRAVLDNALRENAFRRPSSAELLKEIRQIRRPRREVQIVDVFPEAALEPDAAPAGDSAHAARPFTLAWFQHEALLVRTIVRADDEWSVTSRRLFIGLGASNARFAALGGVAAAASVPLALAVDVVMGVFR